MSFSERLAKLQKNHSITQEAAPVTQDAVPFEERLRRFRAESGWTNRISDEGVAGLLGGTILADGLILVDRSIPLDLPHGTEPLCSIKSSPVRIFADGEEIESSRLLFLDIETTGLAGGTGTLAFLLGLGRIEDEHFHLRQFFLTGFKGESRFLSEAASWLAEAGHLVTFNGKCFDIPVLSARYRLSRLKDPFSHLGHIDLLYPTRRAFAKLWPDCRLQTAEQQLLNFMRVDDLPGCLIPRVWCDFVRLGLVYRVPAILQHNRWDLFTLAALLGVLSNLYSEPSRVEMDVLCMARALIRSGDRENAYEHLKNGRKWLGRDGLLELANFHRKRGECREALHIWEELSGKGSLEAMENLAKYHEHVSADYEGALRITRLLLDSDETNPNYRKREERLVRKLSAISDHLSAKE
ncbi:MAG: ribonuclease H-like domain-containing protein [Pseudomonadota bacterium]